MDGLRGILVLISFLTVLFMLTGAVSAVNWTVNPGDSIQSVINSTSDNDTIIVNDNGGSAYTYTENLVINKKLQLQAKTGGLVTLKALNPSSPVITVNSGGSGTTIQGFTITGATSSSGIYLNTTSNCNIIRNYLANNRDGIYLYKGTNNAISGNTITSNSGSGIWLPFSNSNTISGNTIKNNQEGISLGYSNNNIISGNTITNHTAHGIYLDSSNNNIISGNNVINSHYGIRIRDSLANVNFNRIIGNDLYGLMIEGSSTVDATNNWWGSNNPSVSSSSISSSGPSDIYIGGKITYDWLVLKIAAPASNKGNSTIIADLTHNNLGEDTSAQGHIPDGIPVKFTTTLGTITSSSTTINGIAQATFNGGPIAGIADISAAVDNQTAHALVTVVDITPPTAWANIKGGLYNTTKIITLSMSEPGTIYYTLNGTTPTTTSTKYTGPITITSTTTLNFIAVDKAGNPSPVYTQKYTIDRIAPKVISTYPRNYATGFSRTATIAIKFSESIKASFNWSKIYMKNLSTGKTVSISKWISGNTLYIKMTLRRYAYNWYQIYIPRAAVKDYAGNNLVTGYTLKFKTGRY